MILQQITDLVNGFDDGGGYAHGDNEAINDIKSHYSHMAGVKIRASGHLLISHNNVRGIASKCAGGGTRGAVTGFSHGSGVRMRKYLRECVPEYSTIITLTYPNGLGFDGRDCKRDLKVFLQRLRRLCQKMQGSTWSAFWFGEFQARGAVHYHVFTTGRIDKHVLSRIWYDIVGSEDIRHLQAGTNVQAIRSGRHGICAYAAKYAAKSEQKLIPDGFGWFGRFWGVCGCRLMVSADTTVSISSYSLASVRRRVKQLQDCIDDAVYCGQARMLPAKNSNLVVYYINDKQLQSHLLDRLRVMELTMALYMPVRQHYMWPELADDISKE